MTFPTKPIVGQYYADERTGKMYTWNTTKWVEISPGYTKDLTPSSGQLNMYPSLNHAWQEYLTVRKLLGL